VGLILGRMMTQDDKLQVNQQVGTFDAQPVKVLP
jgi:hypothetical protein